MLKKYCRSPKELIEYVGRTPFVLRQNQIRNEDLMEENEKIYKRNTPLHMYLPIFLMNRIPSDVYRIKN
jgi:hypothetical protein